MPLALENLVQSLDSRSAGSRLKHNGSFANAGWRVEAGLLSGMRGVKEAQENKPAEQGDEQHPSCFGRGVLSEERPHNISPKVRLAALPVRRFFRCLFWSLGKRSLRWIWKDVAAVATFAGRRADLFRAVRARLGGPVF